MKKSFTMASLMFLLLVFSACRNQVSGTAESDPERQDIESGQDVTSKKAANDDYPMSSAEIVADRLEVYYFHRTARCNSCKTIGRYIKETMEQNYDAEIKEGKIAYREINVEESENFDIANKFQASGSSLKINRIASGQDNIEEDAAVWRLLGDEEAFKAHLIAKIDSYLGI